MAFRNERTGQDAADAGRQENFHAYYDAAVEKVRGGFGQRHAMFIGGKEAWSRDGTFADTRPANRKLELGLFQKGTRAEARRAVAAAKAGRPGGSAKPVMDSGRVTYTGADNMTERKFDP